MERKPVVIAQEALEKEAAVCEQIKALWASRGRTPRAFVDTYGCQQNEADSEKLRGYLAEMGYGFTQDEFEADVIVVNTCAVREHAEMRVLGNVGQLNHSKNMFNFGAYRGFLMLTAFDLCLGACGVLLTLAGTAIDFVVDRLTGLVLLQRSWSFLRSEIAAVPIDLFLISGKKFRGHRNIIDSQHPFQIVGLIAALSFVVVRLDNAYPFLPRYDALNLV